MAHKKHFKLTLTLLVLVGACGKKPVQPLPLLESRSAVISENANPITSLDGSDRRISPQNPPRQSIADTSAQPDAAPQDGDEPPPATDPLPSPTFTPTTHDLAAIAGFIDAIPANTKYIAVADGIHRKENSRAIVTLLAQALTQKYSNEKICIFLETTPHIHEAWQTYRQSGGTLTEYESQFLPIAERVLPGVPDGELNNVASTFVEPSYAMANYIRQHSPAIDFYGVDFDYTDNARVRTLLENSNHRTRSLDDNTYVDLLARQRNLLMADNISRKYRDSICERGISQTGSGHVYPTTNQSESFSEYTGEPVAGIPEMLETRLIGSHYIIHISEDERTCPAGSAQTNSADCSINTGEPTVANLWIRLPKEFVRGRR